MPVPLRIVPDLDILAHRLTFTGRFQDGQLMLPRYNGRRIRLPTQIEQDFGFRFVFCQTLSCRTYVRFTEV